MKPDRHAQIVRGRMRRSPKYRQTFHETGERIDLAMLVREMRESAGLTQKQLAGRIGTTQSVIARLEDAEYGGHSLSMLERIAPACGVSLSLHAEGKESRFVRDVPLVAAV